MRYIFILLHNGLTEPKKYDTFAQFHTTHMCGHQSLKYCIQRGFFLQRFFKIEEERHKREMALQLEQTKIEAKSRREERQHELAVLQLLTCNAYTPTTSTQSSAGPVVCSPTGYDDPGQRDSRLFGWGYGTMGGVVDESARSYSSSESSYTPL